MDSDRRGPVEAPAVGIEKDIRAVEEAEIGAGPGDGAVDRVGEIRERDRHLLAGFGVDSPGLVVEHPPVGGLAVDRGREV